MKFFFKSLILLIDARLELCLLLFVLKGFLFELLNADLLNLLYSTSESDSEDIISASL